MTYRAVIEIILLYLLILILIMQIFSSQSIVNYSQIFYNFSLGIGAILAGIGGIKILSEYARKLQYERKIRHWKSIYDPTFHDKNFKLINSSDNLDWIYVHDLNSDQKIHIGSDATFREFGFSRKWIKTLPLDDFNRIKTVEDIILTRGEFGS